MPSRCVGACPTTPSRACTTWTRRRWRGAARVRSSGSPTSWAPSAARTSARCCRRCSTRAHGAQRKARRGVRPLQSRTLRSCPRASPRPRRSREPEATRARVHERQPARGARCAASRCSRCSPRARAYAGRTAGRRPRRPAGGGACPISSSSASFVAAVIGGAAALVGSSEWGDDGGTNTLRGSGDGTRHFVPQLGGPLEAPFPSEPQSISCYSTALLTGPDDALQGARRDARGSARQANRVGLDAGCSEWCSAAATGSRCRLRSSTTASSPGCRPTGARLDCVRMVDPRGSLAADALRAPRREGRPQVPDRRRPAGQLRLRWAASPSPTSCA